MNRKETIELANEWLESVPDIRERIRLIDVALKKNSYGIDTIEELKYKRHKLNRKLSKIIRAIGSLSEENQKIICYRYFEQLNYSQIARRVNLSPSTIPKRIKKILLSLGQSMFGMEDEFWRALGI